MGKAWATAASSELNPPTERHPRNAADASTVLHSDPQYLRVTVTLVLMLERTLGPRR